MLRGLIHQSTNLKFSTVFLKINVAANDVSLQTDFLKITEEADHLPTYNLLIDHLMEYKKIDLCGLTFLRDILYRIEIN